MNAEFTLTFWRESFGMLALQIVGVVAIAAIAHYLVQSASWRRSIWQIAIATAGLLTIAEWSGAGRNTMNWAEMKLAARRTMAAVHPMTPESTPTFQSELTPVVPISTSLTSDRADSVSEPLSPPPVASSFKKSEATTATPAVWWPAWLWFAGFAVLSLRFLLLNSVFFLFRFFRRLPVHAALAARVQGLVPRLGLKRGVRVVALRGLTGPVAFGVVRPTIGVPPDYSHDFTPAEQDAMLAHELAHLSANDPAWSWLADMVSAVLWWHPLIWIARRQLRSASETAADEASALLQDGPETLAECLVNLGAKLASGPVYGGMGVAERGFRSALGQRVERLLKLRPGSWQPPRRWISLATKCFALTGLLIIAIGCGAWMSPRSSQPGPVMDAFWHSLDVSAMSGLFAAQVDLSARPHRAPGKAVILVTNDSNSNPILGDIPYYGRPFRSVSSNTTSNVALTGQAAVKMETLLTRTYKVDPSLFLRGLTNAVAINDAGQRTLVTAPVDNKDLIIPPVNRNALLIDSPSQVKLDLPDPATEYVTQSKSDLPRVNGGWVTYVTSTNTTPALHELVRRYFTKVGVDLTAPRTVFFNDRNGLLMIRATAEDFEVIGPAIEQLNSGAIPTAFASPAQNGAPAAAALQESRGKPGVKQEEDAPRSSNVYSTNAVGYIIRSNITATGLAPSNSETLHTRTYKVDPNRFLRALERYSRGELGSPTGYQELVRLFFNNAGVDLAAPKSVFFNDRNGLLLARATLKDLEIIQQAIEVLNSAPAQVTIEARFAELKESDRGALGFNWFAGIQNLALQTNNLAPSKTNELAGAITGILTENQFRTVMKALEQRGGVDILSAPRVTTLSGRQAQISALDSKSIVTGVNSKTSSDGTVTSSPVVTPTPFGPMLDIIPNVSADGYSIQITVTATVTEFLGYEKPAPALQDSWGKVSKDAIPLPITRTRQVTTSAVVWDGQTLVLGGLMSENVVKVKDKVPVLGDVPLLGRLFRSESKIAQKKNLLIFVTPTLIDPAGNRVHTEESLRSQQTILPQP